MLRVIAGAFVVAAALLASRVSETADLLRFPIAWAGVLLALDGAARLRHGRSPLPAASDWIASAATSVLFWDVFELVNLRLQNWWYTGVPESFLASAAFSAISFATVLPAVRLGLAVLTPERLAPVAATRGRAGRPLALGIGALALALAFPRFSFPLAWVFLWPLCEAAASVLPRSRGLPSPLEAWRAGDRGHVLRLLALALPLGITWEALNWGCARGWVYTVPWFERPKLFEMPLPGYLGYFPFLLEAGAALALLERVRPMLDGRLGALALGAVAALHFGADVAARARSEVSTVPALAQLRGGPPEGLRERGIETPRQLLEGAPDATPRLRAVAELVEATRMGVPRAERYVDAGLDRRSLASARWQDVAARLGDEPPLVRLWIRSAARCDSR